MAMIASGGEHARTFRHVHLFCGVGAGAKGFNMANPRIGPLRGEFQCAGGIDVDAGAIANFERLTGTKGTVMDLFDEPQYRAFHGEAPPPGWTEKGPLDVWAAFGPDIDVAFTSAPCKGFSGLLSATKSKTDKYQALNRLTVRGMHLLLLAYEHDPIPIILFENVPRIMTRGHLLLDEIKSLLRGYGYIVNEDKDGVHDCGEIGNLAQTRKRYLLIARHPDKIPPFVYQPDKHALRGVGEVIGKLPLPGDPVGGVHHRIPSLQWQTWVRLALVEAGKDWRSLNRLRVADGVLQDYGLVPEFEEGKEWRDNVLGVLNWGDPASHLVGNQRSPLHGKVSIADPRVDLGRERGGGGGTLGVNPWGSPSATISTRGFPLNGAFSVADPRPDVYLHHGSFGVKGYGDTAGLITAACRPANGPHAVADPRVPDARNTAFGVIAYDDSANLVAGESMPSNGSYAVADPRPGDVSWNDDVLGIRPWTATAGVIPGRTGPSNGAFSVADPRIDGHEKSVQLGVRLWGATAPCLKGDMSVGGGPYAIADIRVGPRVGQPARHNNNFRVVRIDEASRAVSGPGGAGGMAVADPRAPETPLFKKNKYRVTGYGERTGSVIAASTTGDGAFAVADPRGGCSTSDMFGNWHVAGWDGPSKGVVAQRTSGAAAIADPRGGEDPNKLHGKWRVEMWIGPSRAVISGRENGASAIADPRPNWGTGRHEAILRVTPEDQPAGTVPANAHSVTGGQPCVADSRVQVSLKSAGGAGLAQNGRRENYQTAGHFGVLPWGSSALAVSGSACHDNGFNSVADPRRVILEPREPIALPKPTQKLICRIISEDGTWHRPFTTLELGGLQSLYDPAEAFGQDPETGIWRARAGFELIGGSDATVREWIGNAVPSAAAQGMATTIGETLLLAWAGEPAFKLDARPIWVKPLGLALAVDSRQIAYEMDGGLI